MNSTLARAGGFFGAWLGGKAFEATHNYDWMWLADITLCLLAAAVHLPIREARPMPVAAPPRLSGTALSRSQPSDAGH
jgi:predicted MFS family arabinose efflux permease